MNLRTTCLALKKRKMEEGKKRKDEDEDNDEDQRDEAEEPPRMMEEEKNMEVRIYRMCAPLVSKRAKEIAKATMEFC